MLISEAIYKANEFRPNTVPEKTKRAWLHAFEADIAEMMCVDCPTWDEESENTEYADPELLVRHPKDYVYPLWLMPMIDLWNQDIQLYQVDIIIANNALSDIKGYYARNKDNLSDGGSSSSSNDKMPNKITGIFLQ